jgi:hypothetical protein
MKYTIMGFSQEVALFNGLDINDLSILRWIVDFYPKMMRVEIEGGQYVWVNYTALTEDMPLLGMKKDALYRRLQKMVEAGVLKHKTVKQGGTYSYYSFGANYPSLIETKKQEGTVQKSEGYGSATVGGTVQKSDQIDTSTTNNNSTRKQNDLSKDKSSIETLINEWTDDVELKQTVKDYLAMRVKIKKPATEKALKLALDTVDSMTSDTAVKLAILNQSILNSWQGIFPLKDSTTVQQKKGGSLYADI